MERTSAKQRKRNKRWLSVEVPSVEELSGVPDEELATRTLPPGFYLWFLVHNMRTMYASLSEYIHLTRGVLDYLYDYTRWGPNKIHSKLFLCRAYNAEEVCVSGFLCREVHCRLRTDAAIEAGACGVLSNANGCPTPAGGSEKCWEASSEARPRPPPPGVLLWHALHSRWAPAWAHPTLPPGLTLRVALPNNPRPVEAYDSGRLFVTKVVWEHYGRVLRGDPPGITLQHCANFSKNGVCCFGQACQFVHVVHYGVCSDHIENDNNDGEMDMEINDGSNGNGNLSPAKSTSCRRISGEKSGATSFSDSNGATSSKTSYYNKHVSVTTSPARSMTAQPRFHATQVNNNNNNNFYTSESRSSSNGVGGVTNGGEVLLMPQNFIQSTGGNSPLRPPKPQQYIQQTYLSPDNLSCYNNNNPMTTPFVLLSGSEQQQQQPVYTFMLPQQESSLRSIHPFIVVPY